MGEVSSSMCRKAMLRYLKYLYDDVTEVNETWVIINDGDEVALVKLDTRQQTDKPFADIDHEVYQRELESALIEAIEYIEPDCNVRPDAVQIHVVGKDRAIVKHYKNVLGRMD